jgi:gliding motility-associated-like protein
MKLLFTNILCIITFYCAAQCPDFYDFEGNLSTTPKWIVCDGNDYTLSLQSNSNIGNYSINWGDGSALTTGTSWTANTPINHTYAATVQNYTITINLTDIPCVVTGELVMEEPTNASIQIPFGGLTSTCAPGSLEFINSSTDVSENTTFVWSFFDGTNNETYDFNNAGQLITHTYQQGTVNCATQVTLTAENECNTLQGGPSLATFTPLRIWDIDDASITPSSSLLCYPDTIVSFQNTTNRNCHAQGNVSQRYEYWNLGDYWGLGYDSIIAWRPWPPAINVDVGFPGVGTYEVMLIDSSFCGLDSTTQTINIVNQPIAGISANKDTICAGESVIFQNLSTGFVSNYIWDFGDGSSWMQVWNGNVTRAFHTPGYFEVLLIPQINNACRDTASVFVFVSDVPQADFTLDKTNGCDSLSVQITDNSSFDVIEWDWDFGNGNTTNSSTPDIQHYSNGTYTVSLDVVNSSGCSNFTMEEINVYQSPQPNFQPTEVCVNELSVFNDLSQSNDPIVSWDWDFGNGDTSTLQNPSFNFGLAGFFDVILSVSTAHCQRSDTLEVLVDSLPTSHFVVSDSIGCSPLDVSFINQSSSNVANHKWLFGDNDTSIVENPNHIFQNNWPVDTTFNVELLVSTVAGCKDTSNFDITVLSKPIASFNDNSVLDCAPLEVDFINTSTNAINYEWNFGDGSALETSANVSHTYHNTNLIIETFDVSLVTSNPNGCKDTTERTIIVYPEPQFSFSSIPAHGCSPLEVDFPSVNGAVIYDWDFGDGNNSNIASPTHVFDNFTSSSAQYDVKLIATSPFGCSDTTTEVITVFPKPEANFQLSDSTACSPLSTQITNSSSGATTSTWNMGNGNIFSNNNPNFSFDFINTENYIQNYAVNLTVSNNFNCTDSVNKSVSVYPNVTANFSSDTVGCSPKEIIFYNTSSGSSGFIWDFGDGNNSNMVSPSHTYLNTSTTEENNFVSLISSSSLGCKDTITKAIKIYPSPQADFSISQNSGCSPFTSTITNNSQGSTNHEWNFGNGTTLINNNSNFNHQFENLESYNQNYTLSLIASNTYACLDSFSLNVSVSPQVNADFLCDTIGCSPLEIIFINASTGANQFDWDFGDGTVSTSTNNESHLYTNTTNNSETHNVSLKVASPFGCTDSIQKEITIYPKPLSQFSSSTNEGCAPLDIQFNNTSQNAQIFEWEIEGENQTFNTPQLSHTFDNTSTQTQNYAANLIAMNTDGCSDTSELSLNVYPKVTAKYVVDTVGCSPLSLQFFNLSSGGNQFTWDFGDGTTSNGSTVINKTYTNTTTDEAIFNTSLVAESEFNCSDTSHQKIHVYQSPTVNFDATPGTQILPSSTVSFQNNSSFGTWNYSWDFGDNTNSNLENPPPHTYGISGDFQITLTLINNSLCSDSASQWISILPIGPQADFSGDGRGCAPLTVQFENNSIEATDYSWDFGDGTYSGLKNPVKTYLNQGLFSVSLTAISTAGNHSILKEEIIEVYETPISRFTVNTELLDTPSVILETDNQSEFATNYIWDFGDSTILTETNPTHIYENNGYYNIILIAKNELCSDTSYRTISVTNNSKGNIIIPNSFTPNTHNTNNGDFHQNNGINDIFHPVILGAKNYKLDIFNRWGEHIFSTKNKSIGWNGYFKGKLCQTDVYIYKIHVVFLNGEEQKIVGQVALIR